MEQNYRFYTKLATFVFLISLLSACSWFSKKEDAVVSSPSLILMDVNEEVIYNDAHIKGSKHMPYSKVESLEQDTKSWNKQTPIVVHCTNYQCLASKDIAKKLKEFGFSNVRVYSGGVAEWYQLGKKDQSYVVEGTKKQSYLEKELKPSEVQDVNITVVKAADLHNEMERAGLLK